MQTSQIQEVKQRFNIIGNSPRLYRAIDTAVQVASTDLSVLIMGESGVGKENFPKIIHQYSSRKHEKFFAINCGSIPEGTIDSELFGHKKGSFTSATSDRKGYFEEADGGTIFLDEVGELPLSTQVRLLRVLEAGEIIKVGSSEVKKINVRVVAATNAAMETAIQEGKFREDLYYRLSAIPIHIPALRQRKEDIPLLFRFFASNFANKYRSPKLKLTPEAVQHIQEFSWPGNIRQLKNMTEQIAVLEETRDITPEILDKYIKEQIGSSLPMLSKKSQQHTENKQKDFSDEREILYQVLFDMRHDMAELKLKVDKLSAKENNSPYISAEPTTDKDLGYYNVLPATRRDSYTDHDDFTESELMDDTFQTDKEENESSLSLREMEKEKITEALERYKGKRKPAADELGISERSLYRKIKEYNLNKI